VEAVPFDSAIADVRNAREETTTEAKRMIM
jgi:hypothetical protein